MVVKCAFAGHPAAEQCRVLVIAIVSVIYHCRACTPEVRIEELPLCRDVHWNRQLIGKLEFLVFST